MQRFKHLFFVVTLLVTGVLLLAACGQATQSPGGAGTTPPPGPGEPGGQAAQEAVNALSTQLDVDPLDAAIVSVEPVQWPDSCLGVNLQGVMCAMHVVPGYRVSLQVQDRTYVYHTNEDGSSLVAVPDLTIAWQAGNECQAADLNYDQGVTYGPCNGAQTTAPFADDTQRLELAGFANDLASFTAETPVGQIQLFGTGTRQVSPAEQRMVAEWARVAVAEASGTATSNQGQAITWHREGGIAGFCDDLSVSVTGKVVATSCKGAQAQEIGQVLLDPAQLGQLYLWVDNLKPFQYEQSDNATADAMTIRLAFEGNGAAVATDKDKSDIESFAANLFLQVSQGSEQAVPPGTPTP